MIVVDTNVVSETLRVSPDPKVIAWLDAQPAESLFLTSVSYAELSLGLENMPAGKRRKAFTEAVYQCIDTLFGDRILPFDVKAAREYAFIVSEARAVGHTLAIADAQIASIAYAHHFDIASRDKAFNYVRCNVINPWKG